MRNRRNERRDEALDYIFEYREKAGMPVEDRPPRFPFIYPIPRSCLFDIRT